MQSEILRGHIVDCMAEIVDDGHSSIGLCNDWDGDSLRECADDCHQLFRADGTVDAHSAGSGAFKSKSRLKDVAAGKEVPSDSMVMEHRTGRSQTDKAASKAPGFLPC